MSAKKNRSKETNVLKDEWFPTLTRFTKEEIQVLNQMADALGISRNSVIRDLVNESLHRRRRRRS